MEAPTVAPTAQPSQRRRGPRRGRGARRGGGSDDASLAFRPASLAPVDGPSPAGSESGTQRGGRGGRGKGRGRGGRGGGQTHESRTTVNGRSFGGQLTRVGTNQSDSSNAALQAAAPVQPCGKEKKVCGHPDEAPCHAPFACKETKPCNSKIFITCECQAQKQEVKCGASSTSEGNTEKSLPCTEECARLERNRRLAVALNIDQSTHVEGGDHIPFSTDTLNLFAAHPKWCQTQEREFRVFATSDDEKRLRFKPMQSQQRSFIHSLAEDFGLDSESVDPEPHRHVMIWKTPRFVAAPNKTLADSLRLRQQAQRSANASTNVSDNEGAPIKPKARSLEPFNSFRITNARFGLTIEELRAEIDSVLHTAYPFTFDIDFLPGEDIVLKAISRTLPASDLERMLLNLKEPLGTKIATRGYGSMQLCTTDSSLNITRFESDGTGTDGWSRVAAKKSAPKMALQSSTFGSTNAFSALSGNKVTFAKKAPVKMPKAKPAPVVDDWEAAEVAEEEKERVAYASASDGEGLSAASPPDVVTPTEIPTVEQNSAERSEQKVDEAIDEGAETRDWAEEVNEAQKS
ncbi:putative R3H domain, transcription factor NFX1 family, R3H domain superfamily [Septoria linicola]|nr:putative R3H domain, transcription factor NFX1 family, R3H domain superfamily [Septoria linicola]